MATSEKMDIKLCNELSNYIDKLTTSGETQLDKDIMKSLKKVCKQSDDYVKYTHDLLMTQLDQDHSEIRLSAFQICDELFNRSHAFRELILADFQEFMNLTIEASPHYPLPPPKAAAKLLKTSALDAIHKWNEKYGSDYKQISLGYNFLKNCKKMDFMGTQIRTQAEQRRNLEQQQRHGVMRTQRLENVLKEMAENSLNIKDVLIQIENCLKLLLPDPDNFQIHGLMSPEYRPAYPNPFLSYAKRTPAEVSAPITSVRKTSDPSKIKGRRASHKGQMPEVTIKQEPENINRDAQCTKRINLDRTTDGKQETCKLLRAETTDVVSNDGAVRINATTESKSQNLSSKKTGETEKEILTGYDSSHIKFELLPEKEDVESVRSDDFEEISTPSNSDGEDELEEADVVRDHGLMSQLYRMQVEIRPEDMSIQETNDNTDILYSLRDLARLVSNKFIPQVQRWLEVLSKAGAEQAQIEKAIDIKNALELAKKRTGSFRIMPMAKVKTKSEKKDDSDDDDDNDFEDVPSKDGFEDDIPTHLREPPKPPKARTAREWQMPHEPLMEKGMSKIELDPTTSQATIMKLVNDIKATKANSDSEVDVKPHIAPKREKAGSSSRGLHPDVPIVPFGTDLLNWGKKQETPLIVKYESSHRFWNAAFDEGADTVDKAAVESMNKRFINFTGHFEPVKWSCRVPLSNGTLCPRKDRYKCPFHGKIIARSNIGQPENHEDALRLAEEDIKRRKDKPAEWEDPDLQAEIEAATGVSLDPARSNVKSPKSKKRKQSSGLTNIKKAQSTSKTRLEKIVLNPKARRRVEDNISSINNRKFVDKFGNNFAYALN